MLSPVANHHRTRWLVPALIVAVLAAVLTAAVGNGPAEAGIREESGTLSAPTSPRYTSVEHVVSTAGRLTASVAWTGDADVDLYVKDGSTTVASSVTSATPEQVTVDVPADTTLTVVLKATGGTADWTLTIDDEPVAAVGTADADSQAWRSLPIEVDEAGWLDAVLTTPPSGPDATPAGGDLELFLTDDTGAILASSQTTVAVEQLSHRVEPGTYTLKVHAVSGAAAWELDTDLETGADVSLVGTSDPAGSRFRSYPVAVAEAGLLTAVADWPGDADVSLWIRDASGAVLETGKFDGARPEMLSREVPAGDYEVVVASQDAATTFDLDLAQQVGDDRSYIGNLGFNYIGDGPRQVYDSFDLAVPADATVAVALDELADDDADLDLYVRRLVEGAGNPMVDYSTTPLDPEQATFTTSEAGTYRLFVKATSGASGFRLDADVQTGDDVTLAGTVQATGGRRYRTYPVQVTAPGTLDASLDWTEADADLDLYLRDADGTIVASASGPGAPTEDVSFDVTAGLWQLTVKAQSGASPFTVDVVTTAAANTAPVLESIGDVVVDEDVAITPIQVSASDADADALTFAATGLPAGLDLDPDTGTISGTPTTPGTSQVEVTANDGTVDSDPVSFELVVRDVNDAPVVDDQPDVTVPEDVAIDTIALTATDDDGDDLAWFASGLPFGLAIDGETGEITGTPTVPGDYDVDVTASDGQDLSEVVMFTITVDNVNDAPVAYDATFAVAEDAAPATSVGAVVATDVDDSDLTYAILSGNDAGDLAIDEATGELITAAALDFETTPQYVLEVEASDGELSDTATITIDVTDVDESVACTPVSTLDCADLVVDTPYVLDFDGTEGGLADTGFTRVDVPSLRDSIDQSPAPATPSVPDVVGYEPGLLTVDGGTLTVAATKGIQYVAPTGAGATSTDTNTQLNQLGVAVPTGDDTYELATTVVAPDFPGGNNSQQGGLIWYVDEDTYVKVVTNRTGASTNRAQITVESLENPTSDNADGFAEINGPNFADNQDVGLRMELDLAAGVVRGYYTVAGVETQLTDATNDELVLPAALIDGASLDAGQDPTVAAGLFASKRREAAATDVTVTFDGFSVTSEAAAVNTPPTIADIDDATATQGVELDPAIQAEGSDDDAGDTLTYSATGLPAGLAIAGDTGVISGTPTEAGTFDVTVTVNDGTDTAETTFTLTVEEAPAEACTPVSTLECSELAVDTPYSLDFDGTEGGLANTGFTLVDNPSSRDDVDQSPAPATPSFPDVPGYEPDLLTVDGGNLAIDATKGIQYATPDPVNGQQTSGTPGINAQLNGLGVAVEGGLDSYELTGTVLAPNFDGGNNSQQAGLWWFVDEDTYVKLAVVRIGNTTNRVQLAVESLDNPTADAADGFQEINPDGFGNGQDVALRLVIDAQTGEAIGFYSVDGGPEQQVIQGAADSLLLPDALMDGVAIDAGLDPTINAGVYATKRAAAANVSAGRHLRRLLGHQRGGCGEHAADHRRHRRRHRDPGGRAGPGHPGRGQRRRRG